MYRINAQDNTGLVNQTGKFSLKIVNLSQDPHSISVDEDVCLSEQMTWSYKSKYRMKDIQVNLNQMNPIAMSTIRFLSAMLFLGFLLNCVYSQESVSFVSPEILPDHRVTFRFLAPEANQVILTGDLWKIQGKTEQMKKDDNGLWTVTIGPLTPDLYSYSFMVDGLRILDQDNGWIKPGVISTENMFLLPGGESDFLIEKPVPHGEVRMVYYQSKLLNQVKRMHIYFPPGYGSDNERYPVLYLLHGGGDHDDGWISIGRANLIMDNLIATGKTCPMIIVMPSIWALEPPVPADRREENHEMFARSLIEEIIPYVDEHYRTLSKPEYRAIGGLSMPSILPDVFFANIDKFNYYGLTSNGLTAERFEYYNNRWPGRIADQENFRRVKIWVGDGSNAMTYSSAVNFAETMKQYGYQTVFYETDGIHGWPWFRRYLAEFSTYLFK